MTTVKMHDDEVETDVSLVTRLLADQFPEWADLPVRRVASSGTDHALYRLGDELVARLPRIHWAVGQAEKDRRWLPILAPHLPLALPEPLALGEPGAGYPWRWSVCRWLPGDAATPHRIADHRQAATDLAAFIVALQNINATDGPEPGSHNSQRGAPLATRDERARECIAAVANEYDVAALTEAWETALAAPVYDSPPVWLHGDLHADNLLAVNGRLSAVIDFGCLGVGDPACDLQAAWMFLPAEARETFRDALDVEGAAWERARGWALSWGLIALPYYRETNPGITRKARATIDAVLAERALRP